MKKLLIVFTLGVVFSCFILTPLVYAQAAEDNISWKEKLAEMRKEIKDKGYTFTVDYNEACQYNLEELCGFKPELGPLSGIEGGNSTKQLAAVIFKERSRYIGYYTPVKNQLSCGSCWAFGMVGAVEGLMKKLMGTNENMSEQWLVDCNPWGWDCDGGFINFNMFVTEGAPSEACYPYYGDDYLPCNTSCPHLYFIYDWDWVYAPYVVAPVADIKQAIMQYGSVAVGVYASYYFQAYSGGVFNHCTSGSTNHCVVLCGWDDSLGTSGAWLLKNSWGTTWGGVDINGNGTIDPDERGFMWIIYNCNRVGESAAYPIPYFGG
jgi:C1A family cysteine protease